MKYPWPVVDKLLRDIHKNKRPFGGICVLLGGDVKQLLPVESTRVRQIEMFLQTAIPGKTLKYCV